jgi:RNA polymerase-binding transcription factor DksA
MSEIIEREELLFNAKINNRTRYVGVSAKNCEVCDERIPDLRRSVLPGIKTCVECAE